MKNQTLIHDGREVARLENGKWVWNNPHEGLILRGQAFKYGHVEVEPDPNEEVEIKYSRFVNITGGIMVAALPIMMIILFIYHIIKLIVS